MGGNFITLKDPMGHIVDKEEYFTGNIAESRSLEKSDPSYIVDSNNNGIPDNWYASVAKKGGTPGVPNDNDGMKEKIEEALGKVRQGLKQDGGDIELVSVENGVVKVRLKGACCGCPMSQMTLANFVEREIKKAAPEVKRVEAVL